MEKRGLFIVIDGLGGTGKTTQMELLKQKLPKAVFTKEPGGAPRAEKIRDILKEGDGEAPDPLTDFFLFWAARAEHMAAIIKPALSKNKIVFCDRFDSSTFAMQVRGDQRPDLEKIFWACREKTLDGFMPDVYIILDTASGVAKNRRRGRHDSADRFDERGEAYQKRVRLGFKEFATKIRGRVVDATQGPDHINDEIWKIIEKKIA